MELDSEVEFIPRKGNKREKSPVEQNTHKEVPYPKEGSKIHIHEPVQAVLHHVQGQGLGNASTNPPRSDELLEHPEKGCQRGGNGEILQWMESTIIQTSDKKDKGITCQKEGGKQAISPNSFYQKAESQPPSPREEGEKGKEFQETIFPKLQDSKNPRRYPGQCIKHCQNLDGIQGQRGTRNETPPFPKEINLSTDVVNTLTEIKDNILSLKDIRSSLLSLKEINNSLVSFT
ncbi:hypothetical protein O181_084946 [Austropuccinia psidii MF-1]|uniref:Uncharacterized protein n=1 Tax=Austropuccinia psidii MF-1 TaxID=1389203 RepID=A0A9Q3IJ99_9BASI|nr:hypothetical protein [Austropuccinia psidii MF-1]